MRVLLVTALSSVSGSALGGGSDGLLAADAAASPVPGIGSASSSASAAADQTSLDAS